MARGNGGEGLAICCAAMACCWLFIVIVQGLRVSIAKIVMGAVLLHDCPLEPKIPIWLIVSGVVSSILFGSSVSVRCNNDDSVDNSGFGFTMVCHRIGLLFNMAWLICGSIWVYPNYGKIKADDFIPCTENITTGCTQDCHQPLLDFSVAMVTIDWIFGVFWSVLIVVLVVALCVGLRFYFNLFLSINNCRLVFKLI